MALVCDNVTFTYQDAGQRALDGVSFHVERGRVCGVCGRSGAGKTTIAGCLTGRLMPASGMVLLDGKTMDGPFTRRKWAEQVGSLSQQPECQLFAETAFDDVAFGPRNLNLSEVEVNRRVESALEAVHIPVARAHTTSPFAFSGGEKRRIALAGVLALEPRYLVLDEPTSGLDIRETEALLEIIKGLCDAGCGIVLISHDMEVLAACADDILVCEGGYVAAFGLAKEVFANSPLLASCGLSAPVAAQLESRLRARKREAQVGGGGASAPSALSAGRRQRKESSPKEAKTPSSTRHTFAFGVYREGDTLAHRFDPRAKMIFSLMYMIAAFLASSAGSFVLVVAGAVAALAASACTLRGAARFLVPFMPLLIFVGVFDILFVNEGTLFFHAGVITISTGGLMMALQSVLRFACMLLATSVLMRTTSPTQLSDASAQFLAPLRLFGIRVDDLACAIGLTFRFIPVIVDELKRVKEAQCARLATFDEGSLIRRVRSLVPLMVPLFESALRTADSLACGMENRDWGAREHRTCARSYHLRMPDVLLLALSCVFLVLVIVL